MGNQTLNDVPGPTSSSRRPLLSVTYHDPVEDWDGWLVVDSHTNGIAVGGLRVTTTCDLQEVERLARAMTFKSAAFGLMFGGSKVGIRRDPNAPGLDAALVRFFEHIKPLCDSVGFGPDMNTTEAMLDDACARAGLLHRMQVMKRVAKDPETVIARYAQLSQLGDGKYTAGRARAGVGVAHAAHAAAEHLGIANARIAMQGFGTVGSSAAWYLDQLGHRIVALADVSGCCSRRDGFDVAALVGDSSPVLGSNREAARGERTDSAEIIAADCDVLIVAAFSDAVHRGNVERVRAKVVVEGGNLAVTEAAAIHLHARGVPTVPDFIASGGAILFPETVLRGAAFEDGRSLLRHLGQTVGAASTRALDEGVARKLPVRHAELLRLGQL